MGSGRQRTRPTDLPHQIFSLRNVKGHIELKGATSLLRFLGPSPAKMHAVPIIEPSVLKSFMNMVQSEQFHCISGCVVGLVLSFAASNKFSYRILLYLAL